MDERRHVDSRLAGSEYLVAEGGNAGSEGGVCGVGVHEGGTWCGVRLGGWRAMGGVLRGLGAWAESEGLGCCWGLDGVGTVWVW